MKRCRPFATLAAAVIAGASVLVLMPPWLSASAAAPPCRYTMGNATVLDVETGLTWEAVPNPVVYTFDEAIAHCSSLGGGWRAPTMKELASIIDHQSSPAFDPIAFAGSSANNTLSSTEYVLDPSMSWYVDFDNAEIYPLMKTAGGVVRCVK